MNTIKFLLLLTLIVPAITDAAQGNGDKALVRVGCAAEDQGAEVYFNNKFKGECPLDIQVTEGKYNILIVKKIDDNYEKVFEQELRIASGTSKRIEAVLTQRMNAKAQKMEDQRIAAEREQQLREEARREAELAAIKQKEENYARLRKEKLDSLLAEFKSKGIEPNNGKSFKDCPDCPSMVLVSAPGLEPIAIGQYETTRKQFSDYTNKTHTTIAKGCQYFDDGFISRQAWLWDEDADWIHPGFNQTDNDPVVCLNWDESENYVQWLSKETEHKYSLLTFQWWSVAAEGSYDNSASIPLPWAEDFNKSCLYANLNNDWVKCSDGFKNTAPVGSYKPNKLGIYDLWGNVAEWLENIPTTKTYNVNYQENQIARKWIFARGWSWFQPYYLEKQGKIPMNFFSVDYVPRKNDTGFRVMRYLIPPSDY